MKKYLIVKTSSLGDVMQALHVAYYLKQRDPTVLIHWVAEEQAASFLRRFHWIDQVIELKSKLWRKNLWKHRSALFSFLTMLRKERYDLLFDLQGNLKSALITLFARAFEKVGYGWNSVPEKCSLLVTTKKVEISKRQSIRSFYLALVQSYFQDKERVIFPSLWLTLEKEEQREFAFFKEKLEKKPVYLCCFGSYWPHKRLSKEIAISLLAKIAKAQNPTFVFIYHTYEEEMQARALADQIGGLCIGSVSLPLLQHLMGLATWVLATDSAPLHLCAMTTTPSFGLFGPSSGKIYHSSSAFFQGSCPYGISFVKRCPKLRTCATGACLTQASSQALFQAFEEAHKRCYVEEVSASFK